MLGISANVVSVSVATVMAGYVYPLGILRSIKRTVDNVLPGKTETLAFLILNEPANNEVVAIED